MVSKLAAVSPWETGSLDKTASPGSIHVKPAYKDCWQKVSWKKSGYGD